MHHIGGDDSTIYNFHLEAECILNITNENDESMKFCFNIATKTVSIVDFRKEFSIATVEFEEKPEENE